VGSDIGLHVGKNFVESFSERVRVMGWTAVVFGGVGVGVGVWGSGQEVHCQA